ncbi:hypothetical protein ACQPXB_36000 [Amycolatopsis sp. CA-161197]|uniref:hypothetical protein n=1 Tax=Amycolatopsis sp. CA-161197 TaxID=3239922 RepID=UPI003D92BD6D
MTVAARRGREPGPRPKGICPECGELRHLRADGVLGQHKRIFRRHYRGQTCAGVDQMPAIYGPGLPADEEVDNGGAEQLDQQRHPARRGPGERKETMSYHRKPNNVNEILITPTTSFNDVAALFADADPNAYGLSAAACQNSTLIVVVAGRDVPDYSVTLVIPAGAYLRVETTPAGRVVDTQIATVALADDPNYMAA